MDPTDALSLARAQFGLNIAFHILFPTITIGLAWILVFLRVKYARTGEATWLAAYRLWTKVFALSFAMGVVFGINRVPGWMHLTATLVVAIGTTISSFWILALNSWMQTPAGHVAANGVLIAGDWLQVLFNPSFQYRFVHMMLASGLTAAFVTAGLSAWRLLRAPEDAAALRMLRTGIVIAAVLAPLQIAAGDLHGLNTLEHQPAKIAAIEALWKTEKGA